MDEQELSTHEIEQLEDDLRKGLHHVPAPAGFSDRVMARVAQREAARPKKMVTPSKTAIAFRTMHRSSGVWTAIAAMLLLTVGGDVVYQRHQREEHQAAQVQAQLDLAMQLTGHALDQVHENLDKSTAGQILNGIGNK